MKSEGRLGKVRYCSFDGRAFSGLADPAVVAALQPHAEPGVDQYGLARDLEAWRRRLELVGHREACGLPPTASPDDTHAALFALAEKYLPTRLPAHTVPSLRAVCERLRAHFVERLAALEVERRRDDVRAEAERLGLALLAFARGRPEAGDAALHHRFDVLERHLDQLSRRLDALERGQAASPTWQATRRGVA